MPLFGKNLKKIFFLSVEHAANASLYMSSL